MKLQILFLVLIIGLGTSCKKVLNPNIDTVKLPIVVDGLITDEAKPYTIKLTMGSNYNGNGYTSYVTNAKVSVQDDCGHTYKFIESGLGSYVSNPSEFVAQPGRSYTLHIETKEKDMYESSPQLLLPNNFNVKTYGVSGTQDQLIDDGMGDPLKVTISGVNLLVDIDNNADTVPRFRFDTQIHTEYSYTIAISQAMSYVYYCWQINSLNDLVNITDDQYQTSEKNITKHQICFLPTKYIYDASYLDSVTKMVSDVQASIQNRVATVTRYRINSETYQYYKNVNSLLSAQGKLFDPIPFQFKGNITCTSDPQKFALGFFEASSVQINYFASHPGLKNILKINGFSPPYPSGCMGYIQLNEPPVTPNPPDFWVY